MQSAKSGQMIFPAVLDPTGISTFAGGINYAWLQDGILLPALDKLLTDLEAQLRSFAQAFRPIAYEALYDVPLFVAGAGAVTVPAWTVPGVYKLPAILPGLGLMGFSIYRFVKFVTAQRDKQTYLDGLQNRMNAGGAEWEWRKQELEDMRDEMGDEAAAASVYQAESKAVAIASAARKEVMEKRFLTQAEFHDLFLAFLDAPTPESSQALALEIQAAAANLVAASNEALAKMSPAERNAGFQVLMQRHVRSSTALDALRALARGDWNQVPGLQAFSIDAARAFAGE
ncbi:MAG: hypothetical protein PHC52_00575 [Syntrophales bacterium]|nr:hypothetical protein [Syntrophales bacterium]